MSMKNTVFSSGTSRGGTTFFTRILSVNEKVKVSSDPFLPIFKHFYAAVMKSAGIECSPDAPMSDYYFSRTSIEKMKILQESSLDLKIEKKELAIIIEKLKSRMNLAAKEVIPYCDTINGSTYEEILVNGFKALRSAYNISENDFCGFNDNWISEFFPVLAKSFPDSKFFTIIRDPRGSIASVEQLRKKNPELAPSIYSFLRSWRKHASFVFNCKNNSHLNNKLYIVKYEDVVTSPEIEISKVCKFLNVRFSKNMLNTEKFRPVEGKSWGKYSHHKDTPESGIYSDAVDKWKTTLDKNIVSFIEHVCMPEMSLLGYMPEFKNLTNPTDLTTDSLNAFLNNEKIAAGWKHNPKLEWHHEMALENFRYTLLKMNNIDNNIIQENFLFNELYNEVKRKNLCC